MSAPPTPDPARRQIGHLMICFCIGMAYFNTFSTLNLEPTFNGRLATVILALVPIALFGFWKRRTPSTRLPPPFDPPDSQPPDSPSES